ncbi:hypothetical protein P3T76_007872 [Phytophthora citrophthora]|uniref:Uncharacterized protein n=1 Tax=Phytophthora citrophthora TaxID=4793 RepID=A0AAD9GL72_9STRA|nr:hypothetical protein P3T76_007872 [Phytophthora citrophthora]
MPHFPSVIHPQQNYSAIVDRESYKVIFSELMDKVKDCFERKTDANMVVTGNPGVGLSRFYLYFAFQLLQSHVGKQVPERSQFELVLNSEDTFHKYCP